MEIKIKSVTALSFNVDFKDNKGNRFLGENIQLHRDDYNSLNELMERIVRRSQTECDRERVFSKTDLSAMSIATGYRFGGVSIEDMVRFANTHDIMGGNYSSQYVIAFPENFRREVSPIANTYLKQKGIDPTKELATLLMKNDVKK